MSQWETILDNSSHISPVKINPPKNHSTERLEILIKSKGTAKVSVRSAPSKTDSKRYSKKVSMKASIVPLLLLFSILYLIASLGCNSGKNISKHPVCKRVNQLSLYNRDNSWFRYNKQKTKEWLDQTVESYEPYISNIRLAYRWSATTNIKTAYKEVCSLARTMIYTPENELSLVKYLTKDLKDAIYKSLVQLRFQMNEYIESGSIAPSHSNKEDTRNEHIVEDKLKRTAKRILDYIDHIDEEASQAGMKQDEARKKAHEIIESITEEIKVEPIQMPQAININLDSTEVDQIAFELQEITKLALLEKTRLSEQLNLIQSRVSTLPTDNEDQGSHLLINALKAEVDHLRATAEQNIRAKTKSSLQIIEKMHAIPSIKHRMREDMQSAQRAALKDLRQVYVKLYQTNKLLDELAH